ncbi:MAG: HD domain-containing protein [Acidobacteriota bacterium]|jgi:putative nucleotidyltransferase with HDIG domain|nr:HD domain-containing protein [Acidobacteriota bacterium]
MVDWSKLPLKLKVYVTSLACVAMPVFLWCLWVTVTSSYGAYWLMLAAFALVTVPLFLFLPSTRVMVSVGDTYLLAIAMLYGVAPCVVSTFLYMLLTSLVAHRPQIRSYKVVFNAANMTLTAWAYSSSYQAVLSMCHRAFGDDTRHIQVICSAAVMLAVYFISNSVLATLAISWMTGEKTFDFWCRNCFPMFLDFCTSTGVAVFITLSENLGHYAPIIAAPVVAMIWGYQKLLQGRAAEVARHYSELEQLYMRTVESLAMAVDAKDQSTYGHIRRVHAYAVELARLCGVTDPNEFKAIETGALLHDIGKLAVDDYIINKPGKLTEQEYAKVKTHSVAGDEILRHVAFPFPVARYVRHHHERWDGAGYPDGLKGEDIPLGARILTVADSFDAIRHSRAYKPAVETAQAVEVMCRESGRFFDPALVRLLKEHIAELEAAAAHEAANTQELSFRKYAGANEPPATPTPASGEVARDVVEKIRRLGDLCRAMSGHFDLKDILSTFLYQAGSVVPFDSCVFYGERGGVEIEAVCAVGKFSHLLSGHRMAMGQGVSGWAAAYDRPTLNAEPVLDCKGLPETLSTLKAALIVPVAHAGKTLGVIAFYDSRPASYTEDHLAIAQKLTGFVAPLVANAKNLDTLTSTAPKGGWQDFLAGYGPPPE